MAKSRTHFAKAFADHTLLKHAILEAYLESWAFKLLQRGGAGPEVFYIDAFAGKGCDNSGKPGSPTIACKVAQRVQANLSKKPGLGSARMRVYAIEKRPRRASDLRKYLQPFINLEADAAHVLAGELCGHIDAINARINSAPALYFLDPFGVGGLDISTYPKMLSGASNEVFALFNDVGAIRLRGAVRANRDDARTASQLAALRAAPSLFPDADAAEAGKLHERAHRRALAIDRTKPAARAKLTEALGAGWETRVAGLSNEQAQTEFVATFMEALGDAGAGYRQVIPMRDANGIHNYCLVYASKSLKGWLTMKYAVSTALGKDALDDPMRARIREDLEVPLSEVFDMLASRFAGKTVRWAGDDQLTVRRFLLEESEVFDFQLNAVGEGLTNRGWRTRNGRVLVCTFPASASAP